jgi:SAM-dependent methyltransferase
MAETYSPGELAGLFPQDPDSETLNRIRTLLGGEAAAQFSPLFRSWVHGGLIGGFDFSGAGDEILRRCQSRGGLLPNQRVLDVGCGIGRIALPLLGYLSEGGSYEGFDVIASGVAWLSRYATPRFPSFRFQGADGVYSGLYNPGGVCDAARFVFPYASASFDFAIAVSVFTHMAPAGVRQYIAEAARVLKPGGRLFCTAYVLDSEGRAIAEGGRSAMEFPHRLGAHRLRDADVPESAVALDEEFLRDTAADAGMDIAGEIERGSWRNPGLHTGQDILVLEKTERVSRSDARS